MANNQTRIQAVNPDGQTLHVQHTSSDSPILPVASLAQLKEIDPELVNFVVEETAKEASHRRQQNSRINTFIFVEKLSGVVAGLILALAVFFLGGYLIMNGHDTAGTTLCTVNLVAIVALFVNRQNNLTDKQNARAAAAASKKSQKAPRSKKSLPGG